MQHNVASKRPVERPIAGFILSLLGGLFIAAGGIYDILFPQTYYYYVGYPNPYALYAAVAIVSGLAVITGAALTYFLPRQRVGWGVLILVFGVASLFALSGGFSSGFLIGMLLALVGGSLTIAWKPSEGIQLEDYRTCLSCGRHVLAEYPICPFCGARAAGRAPGSGESLTSPPPP